MAVAAAAVTPSIEALSQFAGRVPDGAEVDVVLQSVDQLDVADGAGKLTHLRRHSLIALAAHTGRPIDRSTFAGTAGPVGADLAEVVGEDEGCSAAVGTMDNDDSSGRADERPDCLWRCADRSSW